MSLSRIASARVPEPGIDFPINDRLSLTTAHGPAEPIASSERQRRGGLNGTSSTVSPV